MIVPDINLLLYAEIDAFPQHEKAREWWELTLNGEELVGIAPVCAFGFLRLSTNRRVFTEPLSVEDAVTRLRGWLTRPQVSYLIPGTQHLEICLRLLSALGTAANLSTDAQIAAHAVEVGGDVYSNDSDFGRMEGVRFVNPLA